MSSAARLPVAWLPTVVLVAGLMTACAGAPSDPPGTLPAMPDGVTVPEEYAFGDDTAARDLRATDPVYYALAEQVDRDRLRTLPLVLETAVDVADVRVAYDDELAGARGWDALPLQPGDDAWAQGWLSPDGEDAFALVGLEPAPGETHVSLTVLTTLPDESSG
ncbi:hypothetical protein [Promicromonospora sp. NPDC050249]|uniref:hypothetical protein n=1 Tax=Promicromonospora sp. NPDC050249 TaxID=3154743 RepID=UPI0033F69DAA